jgi:hypothetical protein
MFFSSFVFFFLFLFLSFFCFFLHPQYKYNNSKINQKLHQIIQIYKSVPQNSRNCKGTLLHRNWRQEQLRRVFQRATVTGGAWGHAPPLMETKNQWIGNVFFFPVFLRRR